MQLLVRYNNVDQALSALKKKMQSEGVFREMKLRRHYENPPRRERTPSSARKLARKKIQREGLLPMKPRVIPGGQEEAAPRASPLLISEQP